MSRFTWSPTSVFFQSLLDVTIRIRGDVLLGGQFGGQTRQYRRGTVENGLECTVGNARESRIELGIWIGQRQDAPLYIDRACRSVREGHETKLKSI